MSEIETQVGHMKLVNTLMGVLHKQLKAVPVEILEDAYNLCEESIAAAPVHMAFGSGTGYIAIAQKKQEIIKHLIEIKKLLSEMEEVMK